LSSISSLRKTQVILQAIEKAKKDVSYYALDLDQRELERSLSFLGDFQYVKLVGLLGTYEQSVPWINRQFSNNGQKVFMWLGSSIGNQSRYESAEFLNTIQTNCMAPRDLFIIGFDKRNDAAKIELAYNDSQGVTREFIMNGLDHLNHIMDKTVIHRTDFMYHTKYQEKAGRHVAHYKALKDMTIDYKLPEKLYQIEIKKDEMIHIEHSYKYSLDEIQGILSIAGLDMVECWEDAEKQYRLALTEKRPFHLEDDPFEVRKNLSQKYTSNDPEYIDCKVCNQDEQVDVDMDMMWPSTVPDLKEWEELWKLTDVVTRQMINKDTMLFERPISLRHPFIFYLGHIAAFLDIQITRHKADGEVNQQSGYTSPQHFADIFERGIDPDMDDPTQCNPHSTVPDEDSDWPAYEAIIEYQNHVRQRVKRLLQFWESEIQRTGKSFLDGHPERIRCARILFMCFEHEAMHIETLLYMLNQSQLVLPPAGVSQPSWKNKPYIMTNQVLSDAPVIEIPDGVVVLGHNDSENADFTRLDTSSVEFGWDNEHPQRQVNVKSFSIQSRPVSNGEYYNYYRLTSQTNMPASWCEGTDGIHVRTLFGPCPLEYAKNWPVQVSYNEALGYAQWKGARIPTEAELLRFRDQTPCYKFPNVGFKKWMSTDVDNEQVHTIGDAFELTSTVWDSHDGFEPSEIYPGYSADFFDGKHHVVLGGSWATHPRMAFRRSFRNWYQAAYPYVFSTFRLCN
jgi:EasF-like predicted methyltransferase